MKLISHFDSDEFDWEKEKIFLDALPIWVGRHKKGIDPRNLCVKKVVHSNVTNNSMIFIFKNKFNMSLNEDQSIAICFD
jgi:hypothetical protein